MIITRSEVGECTVLHLAGAMDDSTSLDVIRSLRKAMAEQPDAVVVDLGQVPCATRRSLRVFPTIARKHSRWPGTLLLLAAATPPVSAELEHSSTARWLGVHVSVAAAVAAGRDAPPRAHEQLFLGATLAAPRVARLFARERLADWEADDLLAPALLVVSELVTNAVLHAGTDLLLTLELGPRTLHVGVADDGPPLLAAAGEPDEGGRGLLIVKSVAGTMGVRPTPTGKVVWAVLRRSPR